MLVALAGACTVCWSQEPTQATPQVIVSGSQADSIARRDFVAGKIIIGRTRIENSGVRTVAELLKREPAVTVGSDGRIGLLNMAGYTQILIDGQPPLGSQDISALDLARVEKIEIVKSSVAEFGPFGIAGTINIVTRMTARKTETEASGSLSSTAGRVSSSLALSHHQSAPNSSLRTLFSISAVHSDVSNESAAAQSRILPSGGQADQSIATSRGTSRSDSVIASSNFTWQLDSEETVILSPELYVGKEPTAQIELRNWIDGRTLIANQRSHSTLRMMSLPLKWMVKPSKKSRFELSVKSNQINGDDLQDRAEIWPHSSPASRLLKQRRTGHVNLIDLTYKISLAGGHNIKTGANLNHLNQKNEYEYWLNGETDFALTQLGARRDAVSVKKGLFLQDEWRFSEGTAFNAGISGSDRTLEVQDGGYRGKTHFRLWSPSFHVSKKIDDDEKRQFRLSLARSFKAPENEQFTLRPEIHPLAPCPSSQLCGANSIDTADTTGNPSLLPEKSLGLNLSYEHGIGSDSQITVELYTRRIEGKFGTNITLENVTWSTAPRYVARPANLGNARSTGLDLEIDLSLRDLWDDAEKITVRGSVGLAKSAVDSVPGPDNRLDKQSPWTAKAGATYSLRHLPLKLDLDANWSPSTWVRSSITQRILVARRFDVSASANWSLNSDSRLVFGVSSAFPASGFGTQEYMTDDGLVRIDTVRRKHTGFNVRFETKI